MIKKGVLILSLVILSISFSVYAYPVREFLQDYSEKITGKVVYNEGNEDLVNESKISGYLEIATLKKEYNIKEKIELTDPPIEKKENFFEKISSFFKNLFDNLFKKDVTGSRIEHGFEEKELSENRFGLNDISNLGKTNIKFTNIIRKNYEGYIIEFKNPSIIEYKTDLENKLKQQKQIKNTQIDTLSKNEIDQINSQLNLYKSQLETENEVIKKDIIKTLETTEGEFNNKLSGEFKDIFNGIALDVTDEEAKEIERIKGVKKVWPNYKVEVLLMDSVPLIGADKVWKLDKNGKDCFATNDSCLTGKGVSIAVIDTGVDYTHEDLGKCFGEGCKIIGGYDFINNDGYPMDDHGHGTHVAATAAGNGILKGVAPDAVVYAYKVLNSGGSGSWRNVLSGIERALDPNQDRNFEDHVDIISMSLGGDGNPDDPVSTAVDNAVDAGIVVVIAAGNSGPSEQTIGSPGTARKAITVGASDKQDKIADFSSRGPVVWKDENGNTNSLIKPDIVAPGVWICAAQSSQDTIWQDVMNGYKTDIHCLDLKHISISGTSMATPHIAGAVALLKQKNPDWTSKEIKAVLKGTTVDIGENIITQGAGRINIFESIKSDKLPIAELYSIVDDKNDLKLFGTAYSENFQYLKIYKSNNEEDFKEIYSSNLPTLDGLLYKINLRELKDGKNIFKLKVVSQDERISSDFVEINVENIKLKDLSFNDIYRKGDLIPIKAEVVYNNYKYNVFWSKQYEENWVTEGITLLKEKGEDLIAEWNTGILEQDGFYKIKIIFDVPNVGIIEKKIEKVYLDSSLKKGWPQRVDWEYVCEGYGQQESSSYYITSKNMKTVFMQLSSNIESFAFRGPENEILYINQGNLINYNDKYSILSDAEVSRNNCYYYWAGMLEPAVEDIDNDGKKEIIVFKGGSPPKVLVFNNNGRLKWEKSFGSGGVAGGNLHVPLVGDIDNDGFSEIIAYNFLGTKEDISELTAFNHDGSILWERNIPKDFHPTLLIADLDLDGNKEIIIKGNDAYKNKRKMIILNGMGNIISELDLDKISWRGSIDGSPAIGNFDDDPEFEIVLAGPAKGAGGIWDGNNFLGWNNTGRIYIYNLDGSFVEGWPKYTNGVIFSSPVVGDINNDGRDDIIVGLFAGANAQVPDFPNGGVYAFDRNGNILPGWPYKQGYTFWATPALADTDNDGNLEISVSNLDYFETSLLHHDGSVVNGWPRHMTWTSYYSDIFADITGDSRLNVLTTAGGIYSCNDYGNNCGGVYAWDLDGNLVSGFPKVTEIDAQAPLVVFEDDGFVNIVASSDFDMNERDLKHRGSIYIWDIGVPYNSDNMDWPMFMHDSQHTGLYDKNLKRIQELPKSLINNTGNEVISGYLLFKIQKNINGSWQDYRILLDDLNSGSYGSYENNLRTINQGEYLPLDKIFNPYNVVINKPGDYRVYAALREINGYVIDTTSGKLEDYYEFRVIKDYPIKETTL